jgi:putative protein kinase ArgK-like GTPase of G3E family
VAKFFPGGSLSGDKTIMDELSLAVTVTMFPFSTTAQPAGISREKSRRLAVSAVAEPEKNKDKINANKTIRTGSPAP